MKSLRDSGKVAVDSNIIISALLRGKAFGMIEALRKDVRFYTTVFNIDEVIDYIPFIAGKTGIREGLIYVTLQAMPLMVKSIDYYKSTMAKAEKLIGHRDSSDSHLLALALKMGIGIWTNDRDFSDTGIRIYTTGSMIEEL